MGLKVADVYAKFGIDNSELKRGLDESKGKIGDAKKGFMDFKVSTMAAFAAVSGAVMAAKKVFDMGKEGAQLEFVREKFDRLSESVGTTSDALLTDLRTATRGVVSDSQLVASATDFMSLGLAKTSDQVIRLTRVAGALGMDMNQLVLTLANRTTMRFDQLGVAVDGFDERLENLKKTGLSVEDAFTEAFLQQAEAQVLKVGEVADTSAGQIMRMEAEVANLADSMKKGLAPAIADASGALADFFEEANSDKKDYELLNNAVKAGVITMAELKQAYGDLDVPARQWIENNQIQQRLELALRDDRREGIRTLQSLVYATDDATSSLDTMRMRTTNANAGFVEFTESGEALEYQLEQTKKASDALADQVDSLGYLIDGPVGDAYDDFTEKNIELKEKTEDLRAKIEELEGRKYLTKKQKEELGGLYEDLNEVTGAIEENAIAHTEATQTILFNLLEQQLAIDGWTQDEFMLLSEVAARWGLIDDKTLEATQGMQKALGAFAASGDTEAAISALDTIKANALGIPTTIDVNVKVKYSEVNKPPPLAVGLNKPPRQFGGPVMAGEMYIVGEGGPELFVPSTSGQIVNNFNLTANYLQRDRQSLAMDVKMLSAMYGG